MLELALFTAPHPIRHAKARHLRILKSASAHQFGGDCPWGRRDGHEARKGEERRVVSSDPTGCGWQPGLCARIVFFFFSFL